jgi:hypothetical protein
VIDDATERNNQGAGSGGGAADGDRTGGEPQDDLAGAYLLDALTDEEREAFEAYLVTSESTRWEVAQLRPVVDLLPLTLEVRSGDPQLADLTPSPELRDRILASVRGEAIPHVEASDTAQVAEVTPAPAPATPASRRTAPAKPTPLRPPGRIRPGLRRAEEGGSWWQLWLSWERVAAAIFAFLALSALIWGLGLQQDLDDAHATATAQAGAGGSPTLAYIMTPTTDGPQSARGVLYPRPDDAGTANLSVIGLPPLPTEQVYQLWFLDLDEQGNPREAVPSVTFEVDPSGSGSVQVPLPEAPFDAVALTAEPKDAPDAAPNPPILMTGAPGTAAG